MATMMMDSMDNPDYDFLSYLDTSSFDAVAAFGDLSGNSANTTNYASPPDSNTSQSSNGQYAGFSPASSSSYSNSPLFGSVPNTGMDTFMMGNNFQLQQQQQQQQQVQPNQYVSPPSYSGFSWGNQSNGSGSNGNSPPFDTSIYGIQSQPQQQMQQMQAQPYAGGAPVKSFNAVPEFQYQQQNTSTPPQQQPQQWQQFYMQQALQQQQQQQQQQIPQQQQQPQPMQHYSSAQPLQPYYSSPISVQEQTPSLSSNSNMGSPHSDSSFAGVNPSVGAVIPDRRMSVTANQTGGYVSPSANQTQFQVNRKLSMPSVLAPAMPSQQLQTVVEERPVANLPNGRSSFSVLPTSKVQQIPSVRQPPPADKIVKTTLKRSFQQATKQEENSDEDRATLLAPGMQLSGSNGEDEDGGSNKENSNKRALGGHNAVEQKYRRGINDSLIMLREIVPALGHLRATPGSLPTKRKMSQFSLAAAATPAPPAGFVDGVMAPKKLSKQLILVTATDYIKFLQSRREELEGELESLKVTLEDCVEDSGLVMSLHEERWQTERIRILQERQAIHVDREEAKENSKKKTKLDTKDAKKANGASKESDEEESDDDEDLEDEPSMGMSSAVPGKGQARSRAKPIKKPVVKKPSPAQAASAYPQNQQNSAGPPKALMSVFAGVSFVGGAGYDMVYGASGAQAASQAVTSETPRVWSHGLVKRSAALPNLVGNNETATVANLHPLQTFFLERPALLSGLVMLSLTLLGTYLFFYILPSFWNRITGSSVEARKRQARETLVEAAKTSADISPSEERAALAILAQAPSSTLSQLVELPSSLVSFASSYFLGTSLTRFVNSPDTSGLERAASAVRLLEKDLASSSAGRSLATLSSFLTLYSFVRSLSWPATRSSLPLLARAEAVLALAAPVLLPKVSSSFCEDLWTSAQARLKKQETSNRPWLSMALSSSFAEAFKAFSSTSTASSSPLFQIAQVRSETILLESWQNLFTNVMRSTISTAESTSTTPTLVSKPAFPSPTSAGNGAEEVLAAMPASSPMAVLALLNKGVEAVGRNDKSTAMQIAVALGTHAQKLASVGAFTALVGGGKLGEIPTSFSNKVDTLAYTTISWLCVRHASAALESTKEGGEGDEQLDPAMQSMTVQLRKLFMADVFTAEGASEAFVDAQEKCVENLVGIGRRAAGLDALSDSGCEL